jgi:XTP/dITP diphosphohydrolase
MMYFITSNRGKFVEVERELSGFQLQQYNLEYPELQSDTLEAVVRFALTWLETKIDGPFFIEDAGLFVEALDGFPGVYSAYAFQTLGNQGILQLLKGAKDRMAAFKSVMGFFDGSPHIVKGICHGRIAFTERGPRGFGYDPIFIPANSDVTFGEMTPTEKNLFSHRGKAVALLRSYLTDNKRSER